MTHFNLTLQSAPRSLNLSLFSDILTKPWTYFYSFPQSIMLNTSETEQRELTCRRIPGAKWLQMWFFNWNISMRRQSCCLKTGRCLKHHFWWSYLQSWCSRILSGSPCGSDKPSNKYVFSATLCGKLLEFNLLNFTNFLLTILKLATTLQTK